MSAFHITCTTCQSRLKVKDESSIGLILSCPKCGSMVMVTAPKQASTSEPAAAGVASRTTHAETAAEQRAPIHDSMQETVDAPFDVPGLQEELRNEQRKEPSPAPGPPSPHPDLQETFDDFDAFAEVAETEGDAAAASPSTTSSDTVHDDASSVEGVVSDAPLPDQWISKETRQMRQWLLAGAAMVFGVLAAVGLVVFLLDREASREVAEDLNSTETGPAAPIAPIAVDPDLETNPANPTVPLPNDPTVDSNEDPGPAFPAIEGAEPVAPAVPGPSDPAIPAITPDDAPPPDAPPDAPPPVAPELGPPELGPAGTELLNPLTPTPESMQGAAADLLGDQKFDSLESMIEAAAAPAIAASEPDPDQETLYNRLKGALDPPRRPAGMHIDAKSQIQFELPRVDSRDVSLGRFLNVMMDVSNVPITLDPNAVIFANALSSEKVTCHLVNASVETAVQTVAKPLGLDFEVGERHGRLVITRHNEAISHSFTAGDLGQDAEQRKWLVDAIQKVIQPETWSPAGIGAIKWNNDQTLSVHQTRLCMYEISHFLETLRMARKLPLQSKQLDDFATGARRSRAIPQLTKLTSVNFRNPAPLETVLGKLSEQTDVQFVIDWEAIESEGWNRRTEVALQTDQESLAAALRLLLTPMELDYLVLDSHVLMITSKAAMEQWREIAIHPVPDLVPEGNDVALALEDVRKSMGEPMFAPETGNAIAFDPVSRSLIGRMSQPAHRQLQKLIDSMRIQQ